MDDVGRHKSGGLSLAARSQLSKEADIWIWDFLIRPEEFPFLPDHRVRGVPIMPGAMYVELALAFFSAVRTSHGSGISLRKLTFPNALPLQAGTTTTLRLSLELDSKGGYIFICKDCEVDSVYAQLHVDVLESDTLPQSSSLTPDDGEDHSASALYATLRERGNDYGPDMQAVSRYVLKQDCTHADIDGLGTMADGGLFHLHPVGLDAGIQTLAAVYAAPELPFVLTGIEQIKVFAPFSGPDGTLRVTRSPSRQS